MIKSNISNKLKAIPLVADTAVLVANVGALDAFICFDASAAALTNVKISESLGAGTPTVVPVQRLVFHPADIASGDIVVTPATNAFTIKVGACVNVGIYTGARNDKIQASAAGIIFLDSAFNPWK
jgi:hypothetical protein